MIYKPEKYETRFVARGISNLNALLPADDCDQLGVVPTGDVYFDNTGKGLLRKEPFSAGPVTVHFDNLDEHLAAYIREADAVVGCMAWLTNPKVLSALQSVPVQILVQKEDFLRPDSARSWSKNRVRKAYESLNPLWRPELAKTIGRFCYGGEGSTDAVRVVGVAPDHKKSANPRMHHKFFVFLKAVLPENPNVWMQYVPYAVWTGSFNATHNGTRSAENAVMIRDAAIAGAYAREHGPLFGLSETLDWQHEWVAPEYRLGS